MSADNWTVCPRCEAAREATAKRYADEADEGYGKIAAVTYEALKAKARAFKAVPPEPTLREDYEIGIHNGIFSVSYGSRCDCGFKFTYEHREKI